MILLLFGPPGCGKGTQAAFLSTRFQIPHISTGEMFRAESQNGTELGKVVCAVLAKGGFISDDVTNAVVAGRIAKSDCARGFLLDGYPRTLPQAKYFTRLLDERCLPIPVVVHLDVPDAELVSRLTARRQCSTCKTIYNLKTHPPLVDGRCDRDGASLICRDDDDETVVRDRLSTYRRLTDPVLEWYGHDRVHTVDGALSPDEVGHQIATILSHRRRPAMAAALALPINARI